jgi:hypothetical protein
MWIELEEIVFIYFHYLKGQRCRVLDYRWHTVCKKPIFSYRDEITPKHYAALATLTLCQNEKSMDYRILVQLPSVAHNFTCLPRCIRKPTEIKLAWTQISSVTPNCFPFSFKMIEKGKQVSSCQYSYEIKWRTAVSLVTTTVRTEISSLELWLKIISPKYCEHNSCVPYHML